MARGALRLAFLADPNSIHTRRWLAFFARRGHAVHLLVDLDQSIEPGLDPAFEVHRFVSFGRRFRPPGALRARRSLRRVLAAIEPDLVHAHAATRYGWLGWVAGYRPLVATVWGTDVLITARTSPVARVLARLLLRDCSLVTAVSAELARAAIAAGAPPDRVRVVHFGLDPERFRPGPRPEALVRELELTGRRVVFSPRGLAPIYRQDVVLEALAGLPGDVVLVLPERSTVSADAEELRRRATALGVAERIRWRPAIAHEAMPDFYRLADAVVSVPESDALAVTVLEAMASGVPVVASDLPSSREGLGDVPEWLVPVGDAAATGAAIRRALELDPARRLELGQRLRAKAIDVGDETANLGAMESAYRAIAHRDTDPLAGVTGAGLDSSGEAR